MGFLTLKFFCFTGQIRERDWYGPGGMEHVRTVKRPKQSIPTFVETVALLMKVSTHKEPLQVCQAQTCFTNSPKISTLSSTLT